MGRVVGLILPTLSAIALAVGAIWAARHRKDLR